MILYIYIISLFLALSAALRHDMQMFQQNSYRYSRYFRWLKGNILSTEIRRYQLLFGFVCLALLLSQLTVGSQYENLSIALIASYLLFAFVEFRKKFKVKLAYTDRVKRLLFSSLLTSTLIIGLAYLYLDPYQFIVATLLVVILSNIILLVANLINAPLEKAITQWYINDARKIIASRSDLIVIGITGSYGKTSTKNYLYRMLTERYNVLITPGNYNTLLGVVRTIREQLRPQHQVFIVEMGAKQRGDIKEICDLVHPSIGIVTSVGEAHLEIFKSVENIQKTKFELIDSLPSDGVGVVNLDSESIKSYSYTPQSPIISYSIEEPTANLRATRVSYNTSGVSFSLILDGEDVSFKSPLLGGGNVLNLVAGVAVASHLGVAPKLLQRAIQQLQPVEHRLSMSRVGGLTILDDAYNSNPTGAKMALDVLRDFTRKDGAQRVIITPGFVEMGVAQEAANYTLGCQIAQSVDYAVVVNRINREAIVRGLKDSQFSEAKYFIADSLDEARAHLSSRLKVGDIILYENDLPDSLK
ncbi:MAG: UDP-N-acetylmuramoyl-tripeptide--D-alanyl-D-alanine ligase [Rikenellaceae bacterium]